MSAADLLWYDAAVEERRRERSACALVAVERAVREIPALSHAGGFLSLYELVERADAAHFTRLWCDPAAYHWVRHAVRLLTELHTKPGSPANALERHLRDFARFALGLSFISGEDIALATPLDCDLPLALPGTALALVGAGRARIFGVAGARLDLEHDGRRLRLAAGEGELGLRLESCPIVDVSASILLNPFVFSLPGIDILRDSGAAALDFQRRHRDLVAAALHHLERLQPTSLTLLDLAVIALKPARDEDFGTLSISELPGAFVCSVPTEPLALAADFVHELHHNRLFAIEEGGAFFATGDEDAIDAELHYSPWRDTPRPLHGLLHAAYVYLPVFRLWAAAVREGALDGERLDFARDQLARIPFQVGLGVDQLARRARFTAFGEEIFAQIATEAAAMEAEAEALGATLHRPALALRASGTIQPLVDAGGQPLSVGESLLAHLVRCDRSGQCAAAREKLAGLCPGAREAT